MLPLLQYTLLLPTRAIEHLGEVDISREGWVLRRASTSFVVTERAADTEGEAYGDDDGGDRGSNGSKRGRREGQRPKQKNFMMPAWTQR